MNFIVSVILLIKSFEVLRIINGIDIHSSILLFND